MAMFRKFRKKLFQQPSKWIQNYRDTAKPVQKNQYSGKRKSRRKRIISLRENIDGEDGDFRLGAG
ncbi:MAG TPA: hypothetical protein VGM64_17130 [Lacunisphaera sp.]|jgi:hypothetical protein